METTLNFEEDAGNVHASTEQLEGISRLIDQQVQAERAVEKAELVLSEKKNELKLIQTELLPEAMRAAGVNEFTTTDFYSVSIDDVYMANIKEENKPDAFEWLKDEGHDDIIKNDVNVSFGKGEDKLAEEAVNTLQRAGFSEFLHQKKHIHWQTLRAFVKEQLTKGVTLPESIDVHIVPTAKIKRK